MATICLISEHASPLAGAGGVDGGGQNVYVAHVARELGRRGHYVDVYTRRESPFIARTVRCAEHVRVIHVDAGPPHPVDKEEMLPCMGEFVRWMLRFMDGHGLRYDVCHANFFMSGLPGLKLRARHGTPLVTTFHALGRVRRKYQSVADRFPDARFSIEDALVAGSDRVIAECPADRDDLLSLYDADEAKIEVVPCGFDPAEISRLDRHWARSRLGWSPERFNLLSLGRLVPRKGVDVIVRSLARLVHEEGVPAHLYIVGGALEHPCPKATPEIGRLREVASQAGVEGHVTFLGRRSRQALSLLYSASDAFITTPWYEPFGITPVEAMACGVPVIGAAVGGIQSTVLNGTTGLLVPPADPDAVAVALARLYRDDALRRRMGARGRARAYQRFTWAKVVSGIERVYRSVSAVTPKRRLSVSSATAVAGV